MWGPYKHPTYDGFKYFITIVDDYTRHIWVHLLNNKSNALTLIKSFVSLINMQFQTTIKVIRTDNALELGSSKDGIIFFKNHGIIHHKSTPYTPQQNRIVERTHIHILVVARTLYFQSETSVSYWGECVKTAVHLINCMPSKMSHGCTLFELLYKEKPLLQYLKVFGHLCFASKSTIGRDKFTPRSHPCIFIGYPFG